MKTIIKSKNEHSIQDISLAASEIIKNGGLVVFPTETVYGIGACAFRSDSVKRIYEVKGRPSDNPLIVHIGYPQDIKLYTTEIKDYVWKLVDQFWPGPLTLVLKKNKLIGHEITGGLDSIAVRCPNSDIFLETLRTSGLPICAPSANISGKPSSTTFEHVYNDLNGKVDMIIDGGPSNIGIESTVVDVTEDVPKVLRPGFITLEDITKCLNTEHILSEYNVKSNSEVPVSPGMKYKHYSPEGEVVLLEGSKVQFEEYVLSQNDLSDKDTYIIGTDEYLKDINVDNKISFGSIKQLEEVARNLFATLRKLDELKAKKIYCQKMNDEGIGQSINNRLTKAATKKIKL